MTARVPWGANNKGQNLNFSFVALQTADIWIDLLVQIFATRKAVVPLSNILSCWADQYGHLVSESLQAKIEQISFSTLPVPWCSSKSHREFSLVV